MKTDSYNTQLAYNAVDETLIVEEVKMQTRHGGICFHMAKKNMHNL